MEGKGAEAKRGESDEYGEERQKDGGDIDDRYGG